jgi:hypothetical protein
LTTYRIDPIAPDDAATIGCALLDADRELLAAAGDLAALRHEIERAVAGARLRIGSHPYPPTRRLVDSLTSAQARVHAAARERAVADRLLGHAVAPECVILPDPPGAGARLPADHRSRKWWPAPFDPLGHLFWYLRYRPWWSTLDAAERLVHRERLELRARERELVARTDKSIPRDVLPALDHVLESD